MRNEFEWATLLLRDDANVVAVEQDVDASQALEFRWCKTKR